MSSPLCSSGRQTLQVGVMSGIPASPDRLGTHCRRFKSREYLALSHTLADVDPNSPDGREISPIFERLDESTRRRCSSRISSANCSATPASRWAVRIGTFKELKSFHGVKSRSHAELIAEAEQAFAAARRLVDEQSAIVQRLERTGGCNSEAVDLLNNLRELLAARERRLARVRSWPSWDYAA